MEKPMCRLCQHRHWSNEPHVFGGLVTEAVKKVGRAMTPKKSEAKVPPKPGIVVGYDFKAAAACPECAERRRKKAEAQARYRAKKGKA
jgi:hypothetical protein